MPRGVKVQVLSGLPKKKNWMTIKELKSKTLYKEYALEIPYSEVDELINIKISELLPTVTLPGFRKGKAPVNIVKKKYEPNILSEVMQNLVESKTKNLLEEKKIKPLRVPKIDIKKYEKEQPVEIEIKIDLEPEIKLSNFEKLLLKQYEMDLDKKTLEENYNQFLNSQKEYKKISSNREIKNSDRVFVNIKTDDNSVPEFLKLQKNLPIITDSDYQVLPDISKKLIEKKVKEKDLVNISFDLKEVLKSKEKKFVKFEIEILTIEESVKFKLNDDFLKKIGVKNEDELKENLKKNLLSQYTQALKQIETKELMDLLDNEHDFELPEGILDEEFHTIWHRLEHAKKDNTLDEDDKKLSDEELKKRYKKISKRRVKLALLIQFIAKEEKINISEKELSEGMINYASQYPGQEKQILEFFKKNPSSIESIKGPILEKKVIASIVAKAKVSKQKLSIDDYKKLQEKVFNLNEEK